MRVLIIAACLILNSTYAFSPLGNQNAHQGGRFTIGLPGYPKALLYYLELGEISLTYNQLILETLLDTHPETYEPIPLLAEQWSISKDKKTFTFHLNKAAQFSDGTPVTANDVVFTWDMLQNPKNKTIPFKSYYSSIESCRALDSHTVEFKAKTLHFQNFDKVAALIILPKHFYSKGDFNKDYHKTMLGSGPYSLSTVEKNNRIIVKRNRKYWGASLPQNIGRHNFDDIIFKTVADYSVALEMFKKGDLDYYYVLISKMWAREMDSGPFENKYILKMKGENLIEYGTQGFAWNLRNELFQDQKVRLALQHLMDRDRWIKDLFYDQYVKATGVIGIRSQYHDKTLVPVPYDPKKAKELLNAAGWKGGPDGQLVKGQTRFEFELLSDNPASERFLTLYQEELKKMGIKMNLKVVDWATGMKLADDRKFDAKALSRSRSIHPSDFGTVWGSSQADLPGSSNVSGYKNPEVDKLAAQIDETFDLKTRIELVKKMDRILATDLPFGYTYEPTFFRLAYWNRYSFPGKGYFNYSNWQSVYQYWWLDLEKDAKLKQAMKANKPLS